MALFKRSTILLLLLVSSCALFTSWEDVMASWVGSDIKEIENLWGPPTSIVKRSEGEAVYQYHRTEVDPSCVHYWIVGDDGIITGFFHEGYCRPIG